MTRKQFIRIVFRDSKSYKHIDPKDKEKIFFIFNRFMTRLYPTSANALNYNGVDTDLACDVWFDALSNNFRDIPNKLEPNWSKLKKTSDKTILKQFSETDKKILSLYPDILEEAETEDKEKKKIKKNGTIKVTKKRERKKK